MSAEDVYGWPVGQTKVTVTVRCTVQHHIAHKWDEDAWEDLGDALEHAIQQVPGLVNVNVEIVPD